MSTCKCQVVSPCTEKHLCNEVPKRPAGKLSPSSRASQSTLKKRDLAPRLTSEDFLTSKFPNLLYRVLVHYHSARHPWGPFVYLTHTSRWVTLKRQTKIKEATEGENDIILKFRNYILVLLRRHQNKFYWLQYWLWQYPKTNFLHLTEAR